MKYQVVQTEQYTGLTAADLAELVNEAIQDGWRPIGGIAIDADQNGAFYYQAMIKEDAGGPE